MSSHGKSRRPDFIFYNAPKASAPDKDDAAISEADGGDDLVNPIKQLKFDPTEPSTPTQSKKFLVLEIKVCQRNASNGTDKRKSYGYHLPKDKYEEIKRSGEKSKGKSKGKSKEKSKNDYVNVRCNRYHHLFDRAREQAEYYAEHLREYVPGSIVTHAVVVFFWDWKKDGNTLVGYRWLAADGTEEVNGLTDIPA